VQRGVFLCPDLRLARANRSFFRASFAPSRRERLKDQAGGNMKTNLIALPAALAIVLTPVAASAQVCGVGIIVAAMVANAQQQRELTAKEAATCGLLLGHDQQNVKKKKRLSAHRHMAHKKTQN
jgi:hypothetical protein